MAQPVSEPELTDDDFLALVDEVESEGQSGDSLTEDPAAAAPVAPADPSEQAADSEAERPEDGAQDEIDETGSHAPDTVAPPATIPQNGKAFQFTVAGREETLPGAVEQPDGSILIPKDAREGFVRTLASSVELQTNFRKFQSDTARHVDTLKRESAQREKALQAERTDKEIEADHIVGIFAGLEKMTEDELFDWVANFKAERPRLELAVQKAALDRDRKALEELRNPTVSPEEQARERTTFIESQLRDTWTTVHAVPDIKLLDPGVVAAVFKRHAKSPDRLVRKGDTSKGEPDGEMFDDSELVDELNQLITVARKHAAPSPARQANAHRNADVPVNPIPPAPRTRAPSSGPGKKQQDFKGDRAGLRKAFLAGDLDSD